MPARSNPSLYDPRWPVGPHHVDVYKESFRDVRRLDPVFSFDYERKNGEYACEPPLDREIEPWKVLVIYSTELDLHKRQKITGGSHGWRHMQFRLPGILFGTAPYSFRYHRDAAERAFQTGNDYWGWRFLSRCTHYLADLGNPFHVRAAPAFMLVRNMLSFHKLFKVISAVHTGYELYVERRFREGLPAFKEALMQGAFEGRSSCRDIDTELNGYIRTAEKRLNPVFHFMLENFGTDLVDVYSRVDRNSRTDVATQTKQCSAEAARVLFREPRPASLHHLDDMTSVILRDVGRMLGLLLAGFARGRHDGRTS